MDDEVKGENSIYKRLPVQIHESKASIENAAAYMSIIQVKLPEAHSRLANSPATTLHLQTSQRLVWTTPSGPPFCACHLLRLSHHDIMEDKGEAADSLNG